MHSLLIRSVSRYISLNDEEISFFDSLLSSRSFQPGEFLLREGEVCKYESFIIKGCFKSYYTDENGIEHIVDFLIEEWWADDLLSFFTGKASTSNIRAIENSEVLQISKPNLEILYQRIPQFERFFRILFQNAYIAQKEQINAMLSDPAEDRYRAFIQKKPYAEERFPQKDIASYLGITPQFLSTMRRRLKGE